MKSHDPRRKYWRLLAVVAVVALLGAACGGDDEPITTDTTEGDSDSTAAVTSTTVPSEPTPALAEGDCFDNPEVPAPVGSLDLSTLEVVDCEEPHDNEIYLVEEYAESETFPGDADMETIAIETCDGGFEDFVGVAFADSRYFASFLSPNAETWANGDRAVICVIFVPEEQLVGSAEATME
jgi:hypothetical protein